MFPPPPGVEVFVADGGELGEDDAELRGRAPDDGGPDKAGVERTVPEVPRGPAEKNSPFLSPLSFFRGGKNQTTPTTTTGVCVIMGANYDCLAPGSACPLGDVPQTDVAGTCPEGGVCCAPPPPPSPPPFVPDTPTPTTPPATAPPAPTPPPVRRELWDGSEGEKQKREREILISILTLASSLGEKTSTGTGTPSPSPLRVPLRPPPHHHPAALRRRLRRRALQPLWLGRPGPLPDGRAVGLRDARLVSRDPGQLGDARLLARLRRPEHLLAGVAVSERGVHDQRHRRRRSGVVLVFIKVFSSSLSLARSLACLLSSKKNSNHLDRETSSCSDAPAPRPRPLRGGSSASTSRRRRASPARTPSSSQGSRPGPVREIILIFFFSFLFFSVSLASFLKKKKKKLTDALPFCSHC